MKEQLIALDASSSCIGYSIWDIEEEKLVKLHYYKLNEKYTLLQKALEYEGWLLQTLNEYPRITRFVIEESFVAMFSGSSNSKTTATLNKINFAYQLLALKIGLDVKEISVADSRKLAFPNAVIKTKKYSGGLSQKEQMFTYVLSELGESFFPIKIVSRGKNKGNVEFEDYCGDMSDAYIVGKGFLKKTKKDKK